MGLMKKDKEYFKKFLKGLSMGEFVSLIEAIAEFSKDISTSAVKFTPPISKDKDRGDYQ